VQVPAYQFKAHPPDRVERARHLNGLAVAQHRVELVLGYVELGQLVSLHTPHHPPCPPTSSATDVAPQPTGHHAARTASANLCGLSNGQLAVAIHAAGIPTNWRTLSTAQIRDMALAGIGQLSLAEVLRIDREFRALALSLYGKLRHNQTADVSAERAVLLRLWSSLSQEQAAVDLAYRLTVERSRHETDQAAIA
jgi:hypothetical protein